MRWLGRGVLCLGIGTVLVLGGCSSTKEGTVRGKVTYQGKPLEYGTVLFHFENGHVVGAMIGPDGTYVAQRLPTGSARLAVYAHPPVPEGFYLRNEVLPPSRDAPQLATLYAPRKRTAHRFPSGALCAAGSFRLVPDHWPRRTTVRHRAASLTRHPLRRPTPPGVPAEQRAKRLVA